MTQTRYRLINGEDYDYLEEGKAYEPDYKTADTGPIIIDLVKAFPNDWKKVRHRPNRKRVTVAMYNQVVAERDNLLEELRKKKHNTSTLGNQIKAAEKKINSQQNEIDLYIVLLVITLLTSVVGWYLALS